VTTWAQWRERHPETLVLARPAGIHGSVYDSYHRSGEIGVLGSQNPDPRLPGKSLVYGMRWKDRFAAVPLAELDETPVFNAEAFGGVPIVLFSPRGSTAVQGYVRRARGETLFFTPVEPEERQRLAARDRQSGSTWAWETGNCTAGKFEGSTLERVHGLVVYWGVWSRFHPDTEIVRRSAARGTENRR
jgi:hypothetical protein